MDLSVLHSTPFKNNNFFRSKDFLFNSLLVVIINRIYRISIEDEDRGTTISLVLALMHSCRS